MGRIILIISLLFLGSKLFSQSTNLNCSSAIQICDAGPSFTYDVTSCMPATTTLWYNFDVYLAASANITLSSSTGISSYTLYGPFTDYGINPCSIIGPTNIFSSGSSLSSYLIDPTGVLPIGVYFLAIKPTTCSGTITISSEPPLQWLGYLNCVQDLACANCIGSFAPEAGKKYLISAWVREEGVSLDKISFNHPELTVDFVGTSTSTGVLLASGLIIDGWQRIEQEFTIPTGTVELDIKLGCNSGNCLFDDIRVLPFDGSMKSFVYDPVTLRLAAELDERNYATFYEYDEEGKLLRIKKETERGIMTIQESKTSVPKN